MALGRCSSSINMLQFSSDKHSGPGWGAGPACLAAPLSPIVVPLLLVGPSLFLCLCLFPAAPPLFSLCHSLIPASLSSFQRVRRYPKGFVLESCCLVLSGTYSLTPLALFQSGSLCHLSCHKHTSLDLNTLRNQASASQKTG